LSNKDLEKDYSNLTDVLQFVFNQFLKDIFVSIPGIIETYDPATKRAKVKPAINIKLTDGSTQAQSSIINVPVIWPAAGGFCLIAPLEPGDPVEIKFSQRGITKFKETFSEAEPGNGIFEKEDAHIIPGYGGLEITPATVAGISLQSEDGENFIFIEDGFIKVKTPGAVAIEAGGICSVDASYFVVNCQSTFNGKVTLPNDNIELTNGDIRGNNVFGGARSDNHKHSQGNDSGGSIEQDTGNPHS